jgi:endogenous inhibitor of DNA gyrase (YacG/DUF329 family)
MPVDPAKDAGQDSNEESKAESNVTGKRCPECGKPANPATLPFCSARCRDVDLNRWLSGRYVIPGRENQDEDGE